MLRSENLNMSENSNTDLKIIYAVFILVRKKRKEKPSRPPSSLDVVQVSVSLSAMIKLISDKEKRLAPTGAEPRVLYLHPSL